MTIMRIRALLLAPVTLVACSSSETTTIAQAVCPPPGLFEHAVCVCEDLAHVGALFAKPGPSGTGSVGVNGRTDLVGFSESSGDWISWQGFGAVGVSVGESLITSGNVSSTGDIRVGKDATIGGDLMCIGVMSVGGALAVGGDERILGLADVATRTPYAAPAGPPCDCDPATFFDVEAAVAAAAQATGGSSSWDHIGAKELHLTGGNYYVTSADVIGLTRIVVDAPSSVFVDGSLRQIGAEQWHIAPGATLDLFVSGSVLSVGQLLAGSPSDPAAFRLYVGGSGETTVGAVGDTHFYGSIYAPRTTVAYVGHAQVVGSIFAKTIRGVGALTVEYRDPTAQPTSCDPPADPDDPAVPVFQ
jgi:hypothetical protein